MFNVLAIAQKEEGGEKPASKEGRGEQGRERRKGENCGVRLHSKKEVSK